MKTSIAAVHARQILDSRGTPTVETEIILADGSLGIASVPSGASKGKREAMEKRDGDKSKYRGLGVLRAADNVNTIISKKILGMDAHDQELIDQTMIDLDGTATKENLGANAILSVSLASAKACAASNAEPLFQYLTSLAPQLSQRIGLEFILPVPQLNLINGGKHADSGLAAQEFLLLPFGFEKFSDSLTAGVEIYWFLKDVLHGSNFHTNVGDEGGFAPQLKNTREALGMMVKAVEKSGYKLGEQIYLGIDAAATTFQNSGRYLLEGENLDGDGLIEYYKKLLAEFPFLKSIEDPLGQDDLVGFKKITGEIGKTVQIVTDDLTVTNPQIFSKAILEQVGNAVIVKYNQIGTLTETLKVIKMAKDSGWRTVLGNRSGETADDFEADLAVAFHLGQAKFGAPARGERLAKYNRLLKIEDILGSQAKFAGRAAF